MSDYYMSLDTELKDVLNYLSKFFFSLSLKSKYDIFASILCYNLESRPEICDLNIQEILPASSTILNDWEIVS